MGCSALGRDVLPNLAWVLVLAGTVTCGGTTRRDSGTAPDDGSDTDGSGGSNGLATSPDGGSGGNGSTGVNGTGTGGAHGATTGAGGRPEGTLTEAPLLVPVDGDLEEQPRDVDVNLGPDARPSDYPDADAWTDTIPPDAESPCVQAVSNPIHLDDDRPEAGGRPAVAWTGTNWLVAWGDHGGVFLREVTADGTGAAEPVQVATTQEWMIPAVNTRWDNDRLALTYAQYGAHQSYELGLTVMNSHGHTPWGVSRWSSEGSVDEVRIDRYAAEDGWLLAMGRYFEGVFSDILLTFADDQGTPDAEAQIIVGQTLCEPTVVGLKSRAAVLSGTYVDLMATTLTWPDPSPAAPFSVMAAALEPDTRIAATAFRDHVVAAVISAGTVHSVVLDPWENRVVGGPHEVGNSELFDYGPDLVAVPERGFLGLCYPRGEYESQSVVLRVLGPQGEPWGTEVTVADGLTLAAGCSIGWSGGRFMVAWWNAGTSTDPYVIGVRTFEPTF